MSPKLQPGTRLPESSPVIVPDREDMAPERYVRIALARLLHNIERLVVQAENESRRIDERQGAQSFTESSTSIDVLPDFETGELITAIIVTGPAGACSLTLGSRHWALTIPASGILVIAPVAIRLDQRDQRNLTVAAPGTISLELMGFADK